MRGSAVGIGAAATVWSLVVSGCGPNDTQAPVAKVSVAASPSVSATPSPTGSTGPRPALARDFDPAGFPKSPDVSNQWTPLRPGTQWVYSGHVLEDGQPVPHGEVFTVTDLTKVVDGVRTVVVWDRDYTSGQLVEAEIAFFAQDADGNVWNFGEYPEEYEDGEVVAAPAWIAGLQGARPGISMLAEPRVRTLYSQGWGPKVNWSDRAVVHRVGVRTCVPAGCYRSVLVTDEFNLEEPGAHQLKYYAPGVGNVRIGWAGRDEDQEVLLLNKVWHLSAAGIATAHNAALEMQHRAYRTSKVYARTPPAR